MNLRNKFRERSLQYRFLLIFFLMAVLPMIAATSLLWINNVQERQRQEVLKQFFEQQSRSSVISYLKGLENLSTMLQQSSDLIDFVLAPKNLREFSENRLLARIQDVSKDIRPKVQWTILNDQFERILEIQQAHTSLHQEMKYHEEGLYFDGKKHVFQIIKMINYDDQQLQGPSAKLKGYLVGIVHLEDFTKMLGTSLSIDQDGFIQDLNSLKMHLQEHSSFAEMSYPFISIFLLLLVAFAVFAGSLIVQRQVIQPLVGMTKDLTEPMYGVHVPETSNEIEFLRRALLMYKDWIRQAQIQLERKTRQSTMVDIAAQVAHDIRSPLSALTVMLSDLSQVAEEKRTVIRAAVQRINDISNSLLKKSRESASSSSSEELEANAAQTILLTSLIDDLISEKRIQAREMIGISIDADINKAYGSFVRLPPTEIKRALSNILNNSIEAIVDKKGRVIVSLERNKEHIILSVRDDGKGIPQGVLEKLGEKGFSFEKESSGSGAGSGLGVYHAKKLIESAGGQFFIQSQQGIGTEVRFQLPAQSAPFWFVEKLEISQGQSVIVVDDDLSIHGIWKGRFSSAGLTDRDVRFFNYTSAQDFINEYKQGKVTSEKGSYLFLVDYEFLNQNIHGLEIIEQLGIQKESILVTSRYEEAHIQYQCKKMSIPLIPKGMAGFVPIIRKES
jgi:signal transduction histidine kinase